MAKNQQQLPPIPTRDLGTFDSQMPTFLYKKNYDTATGLWSLLWLNPNSKKGTSVMYADLKNDRECWKDRIHPDDKKNILKQRELLRNGDIESVELTYRWLHSDGTYHWFNDYAVRVATPAGVAPEIIGSWTDISVHTEAKKTIIENEEHYKKIVEYSSYALFVFNDGAFRFLNNAAVKLLGGKKPQDIIGKSVFDFFHPDHHEQIKTRIKTAFTERKVLPPTEYRIITLTGDIKKVEITSTPFTFQGKLSVQGVMIDITQLKKEEEVQQMHTDELELLNKLLMKREVENSTWGGKSDDSIV